MRLLFLVGLALLLSGCFISQAPKFPSATAATPWGDGGRFVVYEHLGDGRYQRQEVFVIKLRAERAYDFVNEKGETLTMSLHPLGDNLFAGQAKEHDKPDYAYVVFRITGGEAILFAPQCSDQDKAALSALGIDTNDQFECVIDRVADPVGLFKRVELGKPISKLVRE
jgi:hypothetical protein